MKEAINSDLTELSDNFRNIERYSNKVKDYQDDGLGKLTSKELKESCEDALDVYKKLTRTLLRQGGWER